LPVEGVDTHLPVGWIRRRGARSFGEWRGSPCITPRFIPIGLLVVAACGESTLVPPMILQGRGVLSCPWKASTLT
jgi:hypothetical protein